MFDFHFLEKVRFFGLLLLVVVMTVFSHVKHKDLDFME